MNPIYVRHRVNRIDDLKGLSRKWGVEVDLRSRPEPVGEIYVAHDPWTKGDLFAEWLDRFTEIGLSGPLILNTKEDGLESRVRSMLVERSIGNSFFLDTATPTLVKQTFVENRRDFAVRFSSREPASSALIFAGRVEWLWVDCFGGIPVEAEAVSELKRRFKVCLVSPELQGHPENIPLFGELYPLADAICTKVPESWETAFA